MCGAGDKMITFITLWEINIIKLHSHEANGQETEGRDCLD